MAGRFIEKIICWIGHLLNAVPQASTESGTHIGSIHISILTKPESLLEKATVASVTVSCVYCRRKFSSRASRSASAPSRTACFEGPAASATLPLPVDGSPK